MTFFTDPELKYNQHNPGNVFMIRLKTFFTIATAHIKVLLELQIYL